MALLEVKHLKKYFKSPAGDVHAVDDVSFEIEKGRTMGIVGESGCGKTTLGRTLVHLQESTDGQILFEGDDITKIKGKKLRLLRENMNIVFQDPQSSMNPRMTVRDTIQEPLKLSKRFGGAELERKTEEIMDLVGIEQRLRLAYSHELDGGRRQRVGIGRALALKPKFIVCDEPVSALDISIQAQILNLLMDLQEDLGLTYMFITHDLSVVRHISSNISVMYLGQVVETCASDELFQHTLHPYSKALLSAIPSTNIHEEPRRILLKGEITSPINPKPGCRFASRCNYANEDCQEPQVLEEKSPGHFVTCHRAKYLNDL
jgi:peptide/nickel transport system ATP-binding protein